MIRTARCCCKAISITLEGEPEFNGICHCDDCRRRTGSAFGWSAYFSDRQITETSGQTTTYDVKTEPPQTRHFCGICGSTLYWKSGAFPGMTGVAGGNFVAPPLSEPEASYRNGKKCGWLRIPDGWRLR